MATKRKPIPRWIWNLTTRLFTVGGSGPRRRATHLRLYRDDTYLAGWCRQAMADQIAAAVERHERRARKGAKP